jgi:hypothetical protein
VTHGVNPFTAGYDAGLALGEELKRQKGIRQYYDKDGNLKKGFGMGRLGKSLTKTLVKYVVVPVAKEEAREGLRSAISGGRGGSRFGKALTKVLVKDVVVPVAKDTAREGLHSAISGGGKKSLMRKIGRKHIRSVTREIGKVAKSVLHDVLLPEGKQALREEIQHARRRKDFFFSNSCCRNDCGRRY